ncbi:DapH/DapD/GlmU-related protein [Turicibacter bilis]|uniref:DapH/DapD/GlmU-related protein n=1 Tax=Turicibacter bilis TaxID=2735723 RepID=UPI003F8B974D
MNLRKIFINFSRIILCFFYKKKYLKGRWFDQSIEGWKWSWRNLFMQKVIGYNRHIPWPVSHRTVVGNKDNISFHVDDLNNFQHFGCYFQNYRGKITIGRGTYIAPNVGIITENHNPQDLDYHLDSKDVIIGEKCWIGMNSVILPGVVLGNNTVVGAGSVVTKSFEEGNCVIVGSPAKVIKKIEAI